MFVRILQVPDGKKPDQFSMEEIERLLE